MRDRKSLILFIASALTGVLSWALWPVIAGEQEPWDSPYGFLLMLVLGLIFGALGERRPYLWPVGIFAGQVLYGLADFLKDMFFYSGGGVNLFLPLGLIFLVPFCLPALVGSLIGAAFKRYARGKSP